MAAPFATDRLSQVRGESAGVPRWTGSAWEYVDVYTAAETDDAIAAGLAEIDLSAYATTASLTTHEADYAAHGATAANTAGRIVARDGTGAIAVGAVTVGSGGHVQADYLDLGGPTSGKPSLNVEYGLDMAQGTGSGGLPIMLKGGDLRFGNTTRIRQSAADTLTLDDGAGGSAQLILTGDFSFGHPTHPFSLYRDNGTGHLVFRGDAAAGGEGYDFRTANVNRVQITAAGQLLVAAPGSPLPTPDGTSAAQFGGAVTIGGGVVGASVAAGSVFDMVMGAGLFGKATSLGMKSSADLYWTNASSVSGSPDIGLARDSLGVLRVTDGSSGYGSLKAAGATFTGVVRTDSWFDVGGAAGWSGTFASGGGQNVIVSGGIIVDVYTPA